MPCSRRPRPLAHWPTKRAWALRSTSSASAPRSSNICRAAARTPTGSSRALTGDDCTAARYLAEPERLCDLLAVRLRTLHELFRTQPGRLAALNVPDVRTRYIENVERGWRAGRFDAQFHPRITAADAHRIAAEAAGELRTDALLHGDYCLPNIILDDWRFSGFIDLDHAGLSDRHIDVFWGAWTLWFNLHTSAYCSRFLDAYGRDVIDEGKLAAIAAMECFM